MATTPSRMRSTLGNRVAARTAVAAAFGIIVGVISSLFVVWQAAILIGWDACAISILAWTWTIVWRLDAEGTETHANIEDPSRHGAEGAIVTAGVALLAAGGLLLGKAGQSA